MRTTLAIDDDVLVAVRQLAAREHQSMGEVISTLARAGLARHIGGHQTFRNGIPLLSHHDLVMPVTLERVNRLRDELP